jgi:transcriptional regulator with XRE-family HTH domain
MNDFGTFLKELRGEHHYDMEKLTGLSHTYLSSLEKGFDPRSKKPRNPSPEAIRKISVTLNYDYFDLMRRAGYLSDTSLTKLERTLLESKVAQFTDEIMKTEIREMQSEKFKELYNPIYKQKTVEYLIDNYDFNNLSENGIKQRTKELLEERLNKKASEEKYEPDSNKHAIELALDGLTILIKNQINPYFRNEGFEVTDADKLEIDEIKVNLSYELYRKIVIALEDARDEIKSFENDKF